MTQVKGGQKITRIYSSDKSETFRPKNEDSLKMQKRITIPL
jgi:hypothetical protein